MAYNEFICNSENALTGITPGCDFQIGAPEKIFLTKEPFSFSTKTLAETQATWTTGITNQDILPLPLVEEFEDNSEDDTFYVSPITQIATFLRSGKTDMKFMIKFNPALYQQLVKLNGTQMRLIWVDASNTVVGTSPDGAKFQGVVSGTLRVEKWKMSTGDSLAFIPIRFVCESNFERNDKVSAYTVDWNIKGLNGIQPVNLTLVGTANATTIVVDVKSNGIPVEGLTLPAEFVYYEGTGTTTETITVVAESATIPGRYTLTAVAFITGSINLNGVITLAGSYYKGTALAITI